MYANECARRHAIFMKLNTAISKFHHGEFPAVTRFRARLRKKFRMNEVSATNAGGARRLIDFACNARFVSRVLSSSFAISGTPAYNAAIQSVDFSFLGNKAVLRDDEMHTFIDSVPRFLIILLVPNY